MPRSAVNHTMAVTGHQSTVHLPYHTLETAFTSPSGSSAAIRPRREVVALTLAGLLTPLLLLGGCSQGCGSGSGESAMDAAQVFVRDAASASTSDDICHMVYEKDTDAALEWARSFQQATGNAEASSLKVEEKPGSTLGSIYEMRVRNSDGKTVATIVVEQNSRRYRVLPNSSHVGEEEE